MLYAVADIIADVRAALNRAARSAPLSETFDPERAFLDDIVRRSLCDVVAYVHRHAPVERLEPGLSFHGAVGWLPAPVGGGFVALPDDFMRLVAFKMSDWRCVVCHAIEPDTHAYRRQFSTFGVAGCPERPVVAIVSRPSGLNLEFFTSSSDEMTIGQYVPFPHIDDEDYVDISRQLHGAVVCRLAALLSESVGEPPQSFTLAERLRQRSDRLMLQQP